MHVHESECCSVNNSVAPAARRIAVAGVLDRHDVPIRVSAGDGQAEAAVQVRDLDDVALHDRKAPKTRRILVTRELDDFAILVTTSSSGVRHRLLCAFIIATRPLGAAATASTGIQRATAMAGMERERMDLIALFMIELSLLLIVSCAIELRSVDSLEIP